MKNFNNTIYSNLPGQQSGAQQGLAHVQRSGLYGAPPERDLPGGGHVQRADQNHPAGLPGARVVQDHGLLAAGGRPQSGPGAQGKAGSGGQGPVRGRIGLRGRARGGPVHGAGTGGATDDGTEQEQVRLELPLNWPLAAQPPTPVGFLFPPRVL